MVKIMSERKHYIDNIRWVTVVIVILYHIIYIFNNSGVISNIDVKGIPQLDVFLSFVYPWFMNLLFVVAGMSANYSLKKRTGKEFISHRAKTILVPSICIILIFGWINGWITDLCFDMFQGNGAAIPGFIRYLIYCMSGIGALWFAHELFVLSAILLLVRKIDKKEKLLALGEKVNLPVLLLLTVAVWLSSLILNTPIIEVYRNGIYLFMFLLGYYVFSHENVTDILVKYKIPLIIAAMILNGLYSYIHYGENYAATSVLTSPLANAAAWSGVLSMIGSFKAWFNFENKFTAYMTKRNFAFYALHYSVMIIVAYFATKVFGIPVTVTYFLMLIAVAVFVPLIYEAVSRIPVLKLIILGIPSKKK